MIRLVNSAYARLIGSKNSNETHCFSFDEIFGGETFTEESVE